MPAGADEQVRSVQEELRRRNIFFGDIDGQRSSEFQEAVKRYQRRKGFGATGQEDGETLRSLDLLARAPGERSPKELEWPEEPVLKSDLRINVPAEAAQISRETGVAPEAIAAGSAKMVAARSRREARSGVRLAGAQPALRSLPQQDGFGRQKVDDRFLRAFVAQYLASLSSAEPQKELRFYADAVNYFFNGMVDRRIIERSLLAYHQRWPDRKYSLVGPARSAFSAQRGEIEVLFQVRFTLRGRSRSVKGQAADRSIINAATQDPRIVAIEEHRIRS
jgi:hypothetical protein